MLLTEEFKYLNHLKIFFPTNTYQYLTEALLREWLNQWGNTLHAVS
jgi:hypothetical protein